MRSREPSGFSIEPERCPILTVLEPFMRPYSSTNPFEDPFGNFGARADAKLGLMPAELHWVTISKTRKPLDNHSHLGYQGYLCVYR